MVTAVINQAPASSLSAARAEEAVKDVDAGNKGNPGTEDPQAVVVRISTEGARRAEVAAQAAPGARDLVVQPDGDGSSPVTVQEFKAAAPASGQAPAAAASTPSANQTYELADTNQDGEVSPMEETAYEAKLAAEKQAKAQANAPRAAEAEAAVKTYAAVEQLGAAG